MTTDIGERLVRLETRAEYVDSTLDERQMVISAHSRRLADIEMHLRDHHKINAGQTERLVRLEAESELTRDERLRREHTRALAQWALTALIGIGVIAGFLVKGDIGDALQGLAGLLSPP